MVVGINSNLAASSASANLGKANNIVQDSIARLSSGNRIIKASDDAAGLAIGTSISTTVTSLEIALLNTEQARSVLQIADGALSQINDILARQKALATQSNSGSISDTERGYLNQEFTALTSEIDRIVSSTNFNGITLLDGSIAGNAGVSVSSPAATTSNVVAVPADVATTAPTAGSQYSFVTDPLTLSSGVIEAGDINVTLTNFDDSGAQGSLAAVTFSEVYYDADFGGGGTAVTILSATINGKTYTSDTIAADDAAGNIAGAVSFTFTASDGSEFVIAVQGGEDLALALPAADGDADTLIAALEGVFDGLVLQQERVVSGLTAPVAGTNLEDLTLTNVTLTSSNFGSDNSFGEIGEFTYDSDNNILATTINGNVFNIDLSSNLTIDTNDDISIQGRDGLGDLNDETLDINFTGISGSFDLSTTAGQEALVSELNTLFGITGTGTSTTSAYSINSTTAISGTDVTAVDVSSFADSTYQTAGFGTVTASGFSANGAEVETFTLRTTLGDKTYVSDISTDANGGTVNAGKEITFTATDGSGSAFTLTLGAATVDDADAADDLATAITTALADVEILQERTVSSVNNTALANTVLEGTGSTTISATITSNAFNTTANTFGDIGAFSGTAGSGTSNQLSVLVNGTTFSATNLGGTGDVLSEADGAITLIGRDAVGNDNGQRLTIDISNLAGSIDLTNQDEVNALTSALDAYFGGSSNGSGGLSFQVGSTVTDTISISISAVSTSTLYTDDEGVSQTLSIDTQENAQSAISVLDNAIGNVISTRADIGASISRFNFAASNIEVSIANQDNARGSFLDADIATESTSFATAQVKLQASVSVLAQANQLPQALLQLLQ